MENTRDANESVSYKQGPSGACADRGARVSRGVGEIEIRKALLHHGGPDQPGGHRVQHRGRQHRPTDDLLHRAPGHHPPRGTFYLPKADEGERENWYFFAIYNCYAQYATRIIDNVLFHSIPCSYKSQRSVSQLAIQNLGQPASHGCIRMLWPDAKFIAESCEPGTRVEIYKSRQENEDLRQRQLSESYDGSVRYETYLGVTYDPYTLGLTSTPGGTT